MLLNAHLVQFKNEVENIVYCPEIHCFGSGELIKDAKLNFYESYLEELQKMSFDETDLGDGFKNTLVRHLATSANWKVGNGIFIPPVYTTWEEVYELTTNFYTDIDFFPKFQYGWEIIVAVPICQKLNIQEVK